ncbi:hypothetical protein Dimus_025372 [Dionaea muscipula]
MANQPPFRPWLRLTSLAQPASAPVPQPQNEPRPSTLPAFTQTVIRLPIPQPRQDQEAPPPPPAPPSPPPPRPVANLPPSPPSGNNNNNSSNNNSNSNSNPPVATSPKPNRKSPPSPSSPAARTSTYDSPSPSNGSPKEKVVTPPLPTSPLKPAIISPTESPKMVMHLMQTTPTQSPGRRIIDQSMAPSPFSLPPPLLSSKAEETHEPKSLAVAEAEAEKKTVFVQDAIEKPNPVLIKSTPPPPPPPPTTTTTNGNARQTSIASNRSYNATHNNNNSKEFHKKTSFDSEEKKKNNGMRVITIAGDNKGAMMELGNHVGKGNNNIPHSYSYRRSQLAQGKGSSDEAESDHSGSEGWVETKDRGGRKTTATPLPFNAYMNNNVQGVNNSIMYNSSCTHNSPGVHFSLSRKQPVNGHDIHLKDHAHD